MNKHARGPLSAVFTGLVCIMLALPARSEAAWLSGFTDRVLRQGHEALLPPHLALVLGLGAGEKPVAVRQLGTQSSHQIRTFNVFAEKGKPVVVILSYDQQSQVTQAFLLGRGAHLQKAVQYEAGAQPALLSAAVARIALQKELQYWSDQASLP